MLEQSGSRDAEGGVSPQAQQGSHRPRVYRPPPAGDRDRWQQPRNELRMGCSSSATRIRGLMARAWASSMRARAAVTPEVPNPGSCVCRAIGGSRGALGALAGSSGLESRSEQLRCMQTAREPTARRISYRTAPIPAGSATGSANRPCSRLGPPPIAAVPSGRGPWQDRSAYSPEDC
jgi:hypothetical protein